jgi:hypothetical protein
MAPWAGAALRSLIVDAVPLRLLGALHELVLSGEEQALADVYPTVSRAASAEQAWPLIREAMVARCDRLAVFMTHEPQTNEVGRAACLFPGFLTVSSETGLDLRCFEIGASAGLNQVWDRFGYRLSDGRVAGDPASPVILSPAWQGSPPPNGPFPNVIGRGACDRRPMDLEQPEARRRLKSYVWPDQFDRLARLEAAIALAREAKIVVDEEDAVTWTRGRVGISSGAATVLFHSVMWDYLPRESQAALMDCIAGLGALARPNAPFAWLRMESDGVIYNLRLTVWPGGESRPLAVVHPHGAWVNWNG